ncbi:hypothetical protein ceV_247 [Chrysochromulina ericina virus CeV-01B]|uniref:Uncharacterized protein n=1 Tax=Chrysochromulina ericina virus CeV-01B TaxID=3070830 RepID=A0A0N7G7L9_9VIRU|nr:hypothetical protein ceV_247 [Chrysochromulina ericina virus]ALH23153.1 hypothetical protein ceV_247 [Chrysochromulina ericina virus CeV-01B]
MASKSYTRKRKGGNKWNCNCTLASNPTTKTVIAVPVNKATAATTLQKAVRQRQAAQRVASLKPAKKPTTPTGLESALAIQSAAMSPHQKGMKALMAKPGMTEAKAKDILSRQSNKKSSKGGRKRKTRRVTRKRKSRRLRSKRR